MDFTKNTQTLGFLTTLRANIADAFYREINEGLALFDAGFHNYTSSPLTFIPLELLGSPKNFRSELENINFIQECNLNMGVKTDNCEDFIAGNCQPSELIELMIMLNTFHIYEFDSQSVNKDITSRGSKPVRSEDVVAVKVDGGEYIARAAFLETTSATGNTKAFFEFVIAFNRIKNLELSSLEWEAILVNLDFFDTHNLFENIMESLETAHNSGISDAFAEIGVEREKISRISMEENVQHDAFAAFAAYAGLSKDKISFSTLQGIYSAVEDSYKQALDDASSGKVYDFEQDTPHQDFHDEDEDFDGEDFDGEDFDKDEY